MRLAVRGSMAPAPINGDRAIERYDRATAITRVLSMPTPTVTCFRQESGVGLTPVIRVLDSRSHCSVNISPYNSISQAKSIRKLRFSF